MLKRLRSEGLAIVYISHRMHEIAELADDCTVYRNGRYVATFAAGTKTDEAIIEMMIGREYKNVFPPLPGVKPDARPVLTVRNLSWTGRLNDMNLDLVPGEVVGLGGLDGQGQRNFLLALFGTLIGVTGTVEIDGKSVKLSNPKRCKSRRHRHGADPRRPEERGPDAARCRSATISRSLPSTGSAALASSTRNAESAAIDDMIKLLQIRSDGVDGPVAALSGGNQQKVVIGKWLMTKPRIILLNDPTRGIDVGTKQELYQLLRRLADAGAAILFYSTDYDELIGCCDRVLVFYNGGDRADALGRRTQRAQPHQQRAQPAGVGRRRAIDSRSGGGSLMSASTIASASAWEGLRHRFAANRGMMVAVVIFAAMFAYLRLHAAGRAQLQRHQHGVEQGRAARARGDGADAAGADGRHRPVGRHDLPAHQLPRLQHRRRRSDR